MTEDEARAAVLDLSAVQIIASIKRLAETEGGDALKDIFWETATLLRLEPVHNIDIDGARERFNDIEAEDAKLDNRTPNHLTAEEAQDVALVVAEGDWSNFSDQVFSVFCEQAQRTINERNSQE